MFGSLVVNQNLAGARQVRKFFDSADWAVGSGEAQSSSSLPQPSHEEVRREIEAGFTDEDSPLMEEDVNSE